MTGHSVERLPAELLPKALMTVLRDIGGVTERNTLRTLRTPQLLLLGALQPAMILVIFRYVLGGAVPIPGYDYVDFLVPAIFVEAVMISCITTGIGISEDLRSGIVDRFRSLPMARSAFLAGRTFADLARSVLSLSLMVSLGLLIGFHFKGTPVTDFVGMVLVLFFSYCLSWMYVTIGLLTKTPETAQVAGVLPFFVFAFASSAFVPVSTMPGWLQPFAANQPVSVTMDAVRGLVEGGAINPYLWQSVAWCAGILVVFFAISVRLYRNLAT